MPTIESLTTYQYFSPVAYAKLRETLVCQRHLFEEMATETDLAQQSAEAIAAIQKTADGRHELPLQGEPYSTNADAFFSSPATAWRLETDQFVLMVSKTWRLLLTAQVMNRDGADELAYRVGLTFDGWAIAQFAAHLQTTYSQTKVAPAHFEAATDTGWLSAKRGLRLKLESAGHPSLQAQSDSPHLKPRYSSHKSTQSHIFESDRQSASTEKTPMAQETFILNWAKQMATAPAAEAPRRADTLQTQTQQSLLLDQVVTQIRHSLDLPDILETTVAQVRSFLASDRLVLYQFDPSMDQPVEPQDSSGAQTSGARIGCGLPSADKTSSRIAKSSIVGRSVLSGSALSGKVTYEARASEDVASVLHSTEKKCFTPSRLQRAKFLSGQPIAVDNVDRQYAKADCLLKFLQKAQVKSKIIAPVVVQGQLWGLLIAHQCHDYRHWEETEVLFLQHIAEHLAVAVSQSQLYHQLQMQTTSLESCVVERTQNLHDALMAAETANVTKGEFLSTMSHELRTPLTYIIGMSATLLRWSFGELSDRQRSYLNTINQSGEQLLNIINNILEFAKVESGQRLLDASEVSLSELFDSAIAHYDEFARSHGVTLSFQSKLKPSEDLFWADEKRLQQILSNLTENAIKFTPEGGQVNWTVWCESQQIIFQIEDTGIGIAESQRDELFEKFKQLESPFARQYSGTGLGLAMTKHLVEMHSGTIQVESEVDRGSTFTVCLPIQPKPQHSMRGDISDTFTSTKRIILLEKDEESAAIVCNMLTAAGYEIIWLLETEALVSQLELLNPMMLIANLSLLSLDAGQVKALQLSLTTLDAKVLALIDADDLPLPMAHHDVLAKPIEPKVLLEKVRQLSPVSS